MNPQAGVPRWRVQSQLQTRRPNATGQFVSGVEITFVTASNVVGTIFVPESQYHPDVIRQMIADRVKTIEAVHSLQG